MTLGADFDPDRRKNVTFGKTLDDDGNALTTSNLTITAGGVTTFGATSAASTRSIRSR